MSASKSLFMDEREREAIADGYYQVADGQYEFWEEYFHIKGKKVVSIFQNKIATGLNRREVEVKVMSKETFNIIKNLPLEQVEKKTFDQALEEAINQFKG